MTNLDRTTLVRYAHSFDSGGGIERYLADLNQILLRRNRMTIIQIQATSDPNQVGEEQYNIGVGRFVRVALFVSTESHALAISGGKKRSRAASLRRQWVTDNILYSPALYPWLTHFWMENRTAPKRHGEPDGAGDAVRSICERYSPDLICLHTAGGLDAHQVLDVAAKLKIPVAAIHHFSNDRLAHLSVREQLRRVVVVAGVNALEVPTFLREKFVNVSDGIDTEFFRREHATPPNSISNSPLIFLPARFTPTKGQAEVLRVVAALNRRGLPVDCVLAGRVDSPEFLSELRLIVRQEGIQGHVRFIGELSPAELRDWYGVARVLAFPTRHHEGLGRILIESQAMGVPPVVYNIGGTPEGIRHGETGFLLRLGDSEGLAASIERLLRDDLLHHRMASAGRSMVERSFTLHTLAERHEGFYSRALECQKHPTSFD